MPSKPPMQGVPAQLRPKEPPPPFTDILPSGLEIEWRMPDPFALIAFDGTIPDPVTAAVLELLKDEKIHTPDKDPRKFRIDANAVKGMYGLAAHMLEKPRLDASIEYGDGDTLGRRELGYMDVCQLYWNFRISTRQPTAQPTSANEPGGAADAPHDRGDVQPDASATNAD